MKLSCSAAVGVTAATAAEQARQLLMTVRRFKYSYRGPGVGGIQGILDQWEYEHSIRLFRWQWLQHPAEVWKLFLGGHKLLLTGEMDGSIR